MTRATSWAAAIGAYLDSLRARAYSRVTIDTRRQVLGRFAQFLSSRRVHDVRRVNEEHVTVYAHQLAHRITRYGRPCTPRTQGHDRDVVRHFFAFLIDRRLILRDPTQDLGMPRARHLPRRVPTEAQARRLMNAPDRDTTMGRRDRAILEVIYGSGLRAGEARHLNLTDVDLERGTVLVIRGKGAKDRVVPLSGRSIEALAEYLEHARPRLVRRAAELALFLSQIGCRISRSALQDRLRIHARAAKLAPGTCLHSLRHACATHLLQGGASVRHVQAILGHHHLQSTVVYTHVNTRDLAKVLERAHPSEREWARRTAKNMRRTRTKTA